MTEPRRRVLRPRDAASLLLVRAVADGTFEVLMGRRHHGHVFMPGAWVFPGGRVEPSDAAVEPSAPLRPDVAARLARTATPRRARALAVAAVRETFEETGILLAPDPVPDTWNRGLRPRLDALDYVYRAVTPPGAPRRFNTRFFMAEATHAHGAIRSDGELEEIAFVPLDEARKLAALAVTSRVLAEVARLVATPPSPDPHRPMPVSRWLHGKRRVDVE
ncbi:MAG: NUDIX domain-containing protein [Alphaproteobacteria bacterium]